MVFCVRYYVCALVYSVIYYLLISFGNSDIFFSLKNVYAFSCSSSVFIITVQFPLSAFTKVRWFCDCFCLIVCRVLLSLSVVCVFCKQIAISVLCL